MNHHLRTRHLLGALAIVAAAAATLTGCSASPTAGPAPATVTATATATATARATPKSTTPTVTHSPTSTAPPTSSPGTRSGMCSTAQLTGRIGEQDGKPAGSGSGMNQEHLSVILTNTSTTPCTLQGWPGVSFVGHGNGTQIGSSATLTRGVPHPTVTLRHGNSAQAYLTILDAAVYSPSACQPVTPDGLRIYPPGSKTSLFIKSAGSGNGTVCANAKYGLLKTAAFIPYP